MKGIQWIVSNFANVGIVERYVFNRYMKKLGRTGRRLLDQPFFLVDDSRQVAYLYNSKVACSSISVSMSGLAVEDNDEIHYTGDLNGLRRMPELTDREKAYWKFTFVRNPYARLYSAYDNKMHTQTKEKQGYFDRPLDGFLAKDRGFEDFVRKVVRIPDSLLDRHISIQYNLIYDECARSSVDYIGHFENLADEYGVIQRRFGFDPLPHYNPSAKGGRWREAYTPELADLVYEKYRKDFEAFGYEKLK